MGKKLSGPIGPIAGIVHGTLGRMKCGELEPMNGFQYIRGLSGCLNLGVENATHVGKRNSMKNYGSAFAMDTSFTAHSLTAGYQSYDFFYIRTALPRHHSCSRRKAMPMKRGKAKLGIFLSRKDNVV